MSCSSDDNSKSKSKQFIIKETQNMKVFQKDNWATSQFVDSLVLRSKSPVISVQDGNNNYKDSWTISPYLELDEYVPKIFKGEKTVLFYSDIDTISFIVKPNKQYDFVVLLNNGEKAYTRINTDTTKSASFVEQKILSYSRKIDKEMFFYDTIPFRVGKDHRIHIKGKINNSSYLDFVFDTGANSIIIVSSLVGNKVNMLMDGESLNSGAGGKNVIQTSSSNTLEVENLAWESIKIVSIGYQNPSFDGVIGWTSFEDKIVEIDYQREILVIYNKSIDIPSDYKKMDTKIIKGIPYIKGSVTVNNKDSFGWFEFDTGSDGSFSISHNFDYIHNLSKEMDLVATSVATGSSGAKWTTDNYLLPILRLGELEIHQVPVSIRSEDPKGVGYLDILGNNLLKKFNAIIDFKENIIYLKPNNLSL
ncbi:retropepsin-like aspartic protease [Candidatus Kapabacteria bacterium]|nr:retropepsin-like aspartic protease [Candidatus Kapabacteria bacterium]